MSYFNKLSLIALNFETTVFFCIPKHFRVLQHYFGLWKTLSGRLANVWSINDILKQVIRVGDFIICDKRDIVHIQDNF